MSAPAGWDSDLMTMTGGVHSQVREVEIEDFAYAGWFRRWLGRVVDSVLWLGALLVAYAAIGVVVLAIVLAFQPSYWDKVWEWSPGDIDTGNLSNVGLILSLIISVVVLGVLIAVWWFYFPAAMSTKGGTVGMRLLGTKIVSTDGHHNVRLGQVVARFFFEWLLGAIFLIPLRLVLIVVDAYEWWNGAAADVALSLVRVRPLWGEQAVPTLSWSEASVVVALILIGYLPTLWYFVSPRRQTLYDMVAGTLVIRS